MSNKLEIAATQIIEATVPARNHGSGMADTPARFAKAMAEWTSGYDKDPRDILRLFDDGGEYYDQMIIIRNIPFYSMCEHHMAPFFGEAMIAYIPNSVRQHIMGLSKASRLVDIFARRFQVQERLTTQIADSINEVISPIGVGVAIKARHMCMESRGICKRGIETETIALRGAIRNEHAARQEFMLSK